MRKVKSLGLSTMDVQTRKMAQLLDNDMFLEKVGVSVGSDGLSERGLPPGQNVTITDLELDNGLLVTHVNQTQDLLKVQKNKVHSSKMQTTEEWLRIHGLESMQLTLEDLVKKGTFVLNAENATEQIEFTAETVVNFESKLSEVMQLYHQRIQWLLEDSRRVFGLIKGTRVGLLVDVSDISCGPRLLDFQKNLLCLIDEQLCYKKQLYFLSFGTEISFPWENPTNVNVHVLHKARQWVQELKPSGGCNLLKGLKKVLTKTDLNSLVLVVGCCPDQSSEILSDYIQQCTLGRKLLVHAVTYECSNHVLPAVLKNLTEVMGGRYHCYSSNCENYDSSDIRLLLLESQKAKALLSSIKQIFPGRTCDLLVTSMQNISTDFAKVVPASFLPKHESPLVIQVPTFLAKTSASWLKTNGLKAKKLSLYQVLAPNAFSPVEEFVPILQKTVSSTLHERAMMQFEWHDGTVKNVHVDPPILYHYQKQLGRMVRIYEKRIDWLSVGSRRIWGAICERRVVILVDMSVINSLYIIYIQHSLRLLLEEQMSNKDCFNIIAFGSDITAWKPEMVPSVPDNLQSAWRWILSLQCKGSRNLMSALRRATEVDFKDKDERGSQGIYVLTTGVPDQEMHAVSAYVAEICGGCDLQLHVCLFNVTGDLDPCTIIPARYASPNETASIFKEIVRAANGRFHWFGETGIYESDDISIIVSEMEKAVNYSQKCALLVESLKQCSGSKFPNQFIPEEDLKMLLKKEKSRHQKVPSPKAPAVTLARMNTRDNCNGEKNAAIRALTWRPTSAKAEIPPSQPLKEWSQAGQKKKHKPRKQPEITISTFYIDKGKNVGAVYRKYPKTKAVKRSVPFAALPKEEEMCSSKEWLSKHGLKKLKLELPRIMFGPECLHQKKMVESLHKKVSAKYCTTFPSVEIKGTVKHLHLQPKELEEYVEQLERVLRRYVQRIQWLLSGSRRLFGTILETKVCILIDTSGSMDPYLQQVTKELTTLIWEQLRKNDARFNLLRFAENTEAWQECLVEATDETCHSAVQWVSKFQAHGNTCILKALQKAFSFQDVEALYVLTDGKPDTSCSLILKEIEKLRKKQAIKIHTISFNCADRGANEFLKKLASHTGGRYHRCIGDVDGQLAAHRMLTEGFDDEDDPVFPFFEGDDLKKLAQEVAKARSFLIQAKSFRLLLEKWKLDQKDKSL
ncbi:PREDICTED: von Willebrand factor A domain-containing protein 3A isoform X1 [Crocodylus porosus]|nr:PREDICTED: von Willebrand factor A domain-containing protein 3A isoform X1 [Crocodylus porosus]XP_019397715.1 PREDICTED: von Willebrand factor A domain-containing protein 3A isoform X1 [Crocodylus porosus]